MYSVYKARESLDDVTMKTHLADVLTEGRVGDHLAQEVQVRRHQCHDTTANKHWHVLFIGQSHVLAKTVTH